MTEWVRSGPCRVDIQYGNIDSSNMGTLMLLMYLPTSVSGKAVDDGPSMGAPSSHMEDPDGVLGSFCCCCCHLGWEPVKWTHTFSLFQSLYLSNNIILKRNRNKQKPKSVEN